MSNIDNDKIKDLLNNPNIPQETRDQLKSAADSGDIAKIMGNLSPSQTAALEHFLSDKEAAQRLISSPQAQAILKRFMGK